ncbi:Hsp70 chaperone protein [Fusarium heterosporum]|uniref:Hsp70 chaperone protein n=1 Tax=Fusarium heterosporum TaxID=42747 RepID=A0A8H5TES2_FUSHE|nr:Hsp70 chaperone protein [Fusarium heterosporum]
MTPARRKPPTLVIGIDFGTTYSGVAWLLSGKQESIQIVTDWHTVNNYRTDRPKAPSAIFYRHLNDQNPSWGYATPEDDSVLRWFKLLLIDEKDLPEKVRKSPQVKAARALLHKCNKTPVQVFADYLSKIWDHSHPQIAAAEGDRFTDLYPLHFVVTLPAIWPVYVRKRMTEAMQLAGLLSLTSDGDTKISFISEPEAAALTSLNENAGRYQNEIGTHFVVCDAGGGTVDIITYKIESLEPFRVVESVKGDGKLPSARLTLLIPAGGLCGAIFLDENFGKLLDQKIPHGTRKKLKRQGIQKIMRDEWEQAIRTQVYKPVVDQVLELVKGQIKQVKAEHKTPPKFVLLVGGFGRSQYLRERLQDTISNKISVLQKRGGDPWAAVLRGAVLHGLSRSGVSDTIVVDSRISRFHYGTLVNKLPFNPVEDDPRDREYSAYDREFIAADQTEWFAQIGDPVSAYKPVTYKCHQDLTSPDQVIQVDIITSESSTPSKRYDESVKKLCMIKASKLPNWADLPKQTNEDGQGFRHIEYDLRMISDGSSLEFGVCYENQSLASESIMFDSTSQPKAGKSKVTARYGVPMEDAPDAPVSVNEAPSDDSDDEYETEEGGYKDESSDDSDSATRMNCDSDDD